VIAIAPIGYCIRYRKEEFTQIQSENEIHSTVRSLVRVTQTAHSHRRDTRHKSQYCILWSFSLHCFALCLHHIRLASPRPRPAACYQARRCSFFNQRLQRRRSCCLRSLEQLPLLPCCWCCRCRVTCQLLHMACPLRLVCSRSARTRLHCSLYVI
jgi:hypothetical protein